jgi:hypothetical protein
VAGDASRRIGFGLLLWVLACFAGASFGTASFTRLSPDRLVIFAGENRFVLKRDAAWVLADEKQAARFKTWREKAELPADLSQLVANLPRAREIPLLGSLSLSADKVVEFSSVDGVKKTFKLIAKGDGWVPDATGDKVFAEVAKSLKMSPSTLVLDIADTGGQIGIAKAWAKVVSRFQSPEFFVVIGDRQGVYWARPSGLAVVTPPKPHEEPNKDQNKSTKTAANPDTTEYQPHFEWLAWIGGAVLLVSWAALAYVFVQSKKSGPSERPSLGHHEQQLIEKVRDEQKKMKLDPASAAGAEELVVGKMIEAYDQHDKLTMERNDLAKYKQFKEEFDVFDRQAQEIKRKSDERQADIQKLTKDLQQEKGRQASLQKELGWAKDTIAALESDLKTAEKLLDDVGLWQKDFNKRLQEMAGELRT